MQKKKLAKLLEISENNDGYVSMDDLKLHSIERTYLSNALEEGLFEKVGKGLYLRKGYEKDPYYLLHHTYKKAVFSLRSSCSLLGLLPEKGSQLFLNLPSGYMTSGISGAISRHVGKKEYSLGQAILVTEKDNLVPSYNLERTMIDVIRYVDKFSVEEVKTALKNGFNRNPDKDRLAEYAKAFHIEEAYKLAEKMFG